MELTLRLTVDNVATALHYGDRFTDDDTCPPVKSARPTHDGYENAMITFADGTRDVLGLPQTVRITRDA